MDLMDPLISANGHYWPRGLNGPKMGTAAIHPTQPFAPAPTNGRFGETLPFV